MRDEAVIIEHWVGKGRAAFDDPETGAQSVVEHHVERFAETAHKLGESFHRANPRVAWAEIWAMRLAITHYYERSLDPNELWAFARESVPRAISSLHHPTFPRGP
jgi:uncharacterized protein with HEPN domain